MIKIRSLTVHVLRERKAKGEKSVKCVTVLVIFISTVLFMLFF